MGVLPMFFLFYLMKKLGLIGKNIGYSFSRHYFSEKFKQLGVEEAVSYENFDIQNIEEVARVFALPEWSGANVTIPYKREIIPYIDEISPEAARIGAINTIVLRGGRKIGYNTDVFGFETSLLKHINGNLGELKALVLGDGGAANAVRYVLEKNGIALRTVSRKTALNFETLTAECVASHHLIVQCTPVGTFPNVEDCLPFPFEGIGSAHLVIDLIYNPEETAFMKRAKMQGAKCVNGKEMLEAQAEKAWELWKEAIELG